MSLKINQGNNFDALQAAANDNTKIHLVVQADRPGGRLFSVKLEYEHYRPRSGRNKLYDLHIVQWPIDDNGKGVLLWFVIGIPKSDIPIAEQVAKECGLKITDGIPMMFSNKGQENFPMDGPTVYSLESNSKSNVYKNDPEVYQKMMAGESTECDRIIKADENIFREELVAQGYPQDQIEKIIGEGFVEMITPDQPIEE